MIGAIASKVPNPPVAASLPARSALHSGERARGPTPALNDIDVCYGRASTILSISYASLSIVCIAILSLMHSSAYRIVRSALHSGAIDIGALPEEREGTIQICVRRRASLLSHKIKSVWKLLSRSHHCICALVCTLCLAAQRCAVCDAGAYTADRASAMGRDRSNISAATIDT